MRLAEQYIKNALLLSLDMLQRGNSSNAVKVWENVIKAIVAFAQERSGKDVLAYALALSSSFQDIKFENYLPIVRETLKVAEKIGIEDPEIIQLYEKVKVQLSQSSS